MALFRCGSGNNNLTFANAKVTRLYNNMKVGAYYVLICKTYYTGQSSLNVSGADLLSGFVKINESSGSWKQWVFSIRATATTVNVQFLLDNSGEVNYFVEIT